jgi:hypothetical protein
VASMDRRAQSQRHRVNHGQGTIISTLLLAMVAFASTTSTAPISGNPAAVARAALEKIALQRLLHSPGSVLVYPKA